MSEQMPLRFRDRMKPDRPKHCDECLVAITEETGIGMIIGETPADEPSFVCMACFKQQAGDNVEYMTVGELREMPPEEFNRRVARVRLRAMIHADRK